MFDDRPIGSGRILQLATTTSMAMTTKRKSPPTEGSKAANSSEHKAISRRKIPARIMAKATALEAEHHGGPSARPPSGTPNVVGGRRLDHATHSRLQQAIGTSLPSVRIHDGADADAFARNAGVSAWAYGDDIGFRSGVYQPGTLFGDAILAHEIAHSMQQKSATVGHQGDASSLERDASRVAGHAALRMAGHDVPSLTPSRSSGLKLSGCVVIDGIRSLFSDDSEEETPQAGTPQTEAEAETEEPETEEPETEEAETEEPEGEAPSALGATHTAGSDPPSAPYRIIRVAWSFDS